MLYVGLRRDLRLSSFGVDQSTGELNPTGKVELEGEPCYLRKESLLGALVNIILHGAKCKPESIVKQCSLVIDGSRALIGQYLLEVTMKITDIKIEVVKRNLPVA